MFVTRTVTGRAMQAVAQNTDAARVLGIDVKRMVLYTFLINAVLAVVAALLVTPTYLAKFDMGDSIGQKAFFAAIIGGFNQTRGALVGGVLIGVLENLVGFYLSPAYKEGVALMLFLVVILFRPEGLLGKDRGAQGMNAQGSQRMAAAALVGCARARRCVAAAFMKRSDVYLLTLYSVYLMATMGLNLTVGYAGQMSLGQAAFFGIGAYHAAILLKFGWPFLAVLPGAAITCFVVGLALGFPALRVQHHYLAFATLGFNVLVFLVMRNEEKLTGGTFGISGIPRPSLFGFDLSGHLAYFYFTLASLVVLGLLLWWLLRSPWGRAFAALRDNPIRAESLGVNITAYTLFAFAIGAACAGVGGVYFASLVEFIEPGPFHFSTSLTMLLAVIVGGSGKFFGPVVGTVIIVLLPEALRASSAPWLKFMQTWYLAVFGIAVVALMIYLPGGLLSIPEKFKGKGRAT